MDFLLKQRLIGAVVLVALAVIFIPMLLEGPREPVIPDMKAMPKQQTLPHESAARGFPETEKTLPLPPVSVINKPAVKPEVATPSEPPAQTPNVSQPATSAALEKPPKPASVKPAVSVEKQASTLNTKPTQANPKLGSWIIQAGSFASEKNAFALRDKLRKAGYPTQVERVVLDKGQTYRVRIGPYVDKQKAQAKISKLNKDYKLSSRVMSYP